MDALHVKPFQYIIKTSKYIWTVTCPLEIFESTKRSSQRILRHYTNIFGGKKIFIVSKQKNRQKIQKIQKIDIYNIHKLYTK